MKTQRIPIGGEANLFIQMVSDEQVLDDVVVMSYGAVIKKSDLTGSVSLINKSVMDGQGMVSIEQGLQGRISGVDIRLGDASPGGGISFLIRGANSLTGSTEPLYIVDGFPVSGGNVQTSGPDDNLGNAEDRQQNTTAPNMLNFLNPNDIESIEVLKDASATAIYGSRASNGVVLITTKRGRSGTTKVELSVSSDIATPYRYLDLLDGVDYANYKNLQYLVRNQMIGGYNANGTPKRSYESLLAGMPYSGTYTNTGMYKPLPEDYASGNAQSTNWQDVIFQTAVSKRINLSVSGGNSNTRYYVGLGMDDIDGVIIQSNFKRYSINSNLNSRLGKKFKLDNSFRATYSLSDRAGTGAANHQAASSPIIKAIKMSPLSLINSVLFDIEENGTNSDDPYTDATKFTDLRTIVNVIENLRLTWDIADCLSFYVSGGTRYTENKRDIYFPVSTLRGRNQGNGKAFYGGTTDLNLLNEYVFNYKLNKTKHALAATAGYTMEYTESRAITASVYGFENDLTSFYSYDAASNYDKPLNQFSDYSLLSFLGRANYSYDNRYLITGSIRADGSSKFGTANKWGYFPSVAVAWNIDNEKFLQTAQWLSNLKLRLSYGVTGNQGIRPYQSLATLAPIQYVDGNGSIVTGYNYGNVPNPGLRWETTDQFNTGIDIGLLNNRVSLSANIYYKLTKNLLQQITLAPSMGIGPQTMNYGELENRGLELDLNTIPVKNKNLTWTLGGNISFNRTKVLSLGGANSYPGKYVVLWEWYPFEIRVGESLGNIYGAKVEKVMTTQEDLSNAAKDITGTALNIGEFDYVKDENGYIKKVNLGNTTPHYTFGISSNLTWKRWTFSFLVAGSMGGKILNMNQKLQMTFQGVFNPTYDMVERAWYPDILNADGSVAIPGNYEGDLNMINFLGSRNYNTYGVLDKWVEDGSWVKLKNVTLSHRFKTRTTWIKEVKPYVSVANLFCITNYSGYDPEVSIYGQDPTRRGVDNGSYPLSRTYSVGLNFIF